MERMKRHNVFIRGPIIPELIAKLIADHGKKRQIGAHSFFLGQVRNDRIDNSEVTAIEYSAYQEMAEEQTRQIREDIFKKYAIDCMHIYHSLGVVKAGEICLLVFVSSGHRKAAIDACEEAVERIKKEVPVWGREILIDNKSQWKINT